MDFNGLNSFSFPNALIIILDSIFNTRKHQIELNSKELTADILQSMDLVLLATDHDDFNYDLIAKESKMIIDTRGRFQKSEKVVKA